MKKYLSKKFVIFVGVVILIILMVTLPKSIKENNVKNSIKNQITSTIQTSDLKDSISECNSTGYYNAHIILNANSNFDKLESNKIANELNEIRDNIDKYIIQTCVQNGIDIESAKLFNDEIIDITSPTGKYMFKVSTLTLPNGTTCDATNDKTTTTTSSTASSTTTKYAKPQEPSNDNKIFAWVAAQKIVKDNLKAPSTAKFPFSCNSSGVTIKEIGINEFTVSAYVDAENSFGAKIRNDFTVTIVKNGSDGFTYKDLNISSK